MNSEANTLLSGTQLSGLLHKFNPHLVPVLTLPAK